MWRNPYSNYGYNPGGGRGPSGTWYESDFEPDLDPAFETIRSTRSENIRRQADDYYPFQSITESGSGQYGYPGYSTYPHWGFEGPGVGYMSGDEWFQRRQLPDMNPYETIPLGTRGITHQPDYDWGWWHEGYQPGWGDGEVP